ncbi:protein takeout-like [Euwallacea similis]|uniref:protein takeout-like n=1 Tax=Euwallacea similis TaxID=1736056 RepID=UPI00344DBFAA
MVIINYAKYLIISAIFLSESCIFGIPELPSFLRLCSKSDPNLKQCLIDSIESLRPLMAKGIPEFGIPSCEPLIIPQIVLDQGRGPVSIKSTYRNIEVFGPTKFFIKNAKIDIDKNRCKFKLFLPELTVKTNYTMSGKILMMPIVGSGLSFGNYTDIDAVVTMKANRIEKDGEQFFNIAECVIDFDIRDARLRFENLFNGNEELGDAINLFLNDNWKTVADEIKPVLEDRLAEIFKRFSNKIFHKYPIKTLFPE